MCIFLSLTLDPGLLYYLIPESLDQTVQRLYVVLFLSLLYILCVGCFATIFNDVCAVWVVMDEVQL